ncbi:energy-coupling factor transporter transmembrane protein EcfT [Ruminococcaceae bacterium OttesenSCG-928-A16]|nr:energy-coupling factor transporter transmembrane protein EcfT [Ruminococcaceae bacterium OttesenSCG-928-A16]
MLRDITIGQHFPGNSALHKLDPRLKIMLTIAYIVMLFVGTNPFGLLLSIVFLFVGYMVAKIPGRMVWRSIKPLLPVLAFTAILNLFFMAGTPVFQWWVITITWQGIYYAIIMAVRIVCLIAGTSLLTYTTSPIVLTDAIERLLSPLAKLHFPAHELAMMMTIALRFIPTLIEETDKIMSAQKARGAELDTGNIMQRIKALIPVLIPLFLSAFRRADELAMAMECRCYHGGEGRTRLRQLHITKQDIAITLGCVLLFVAVGFSGVLYTRLTGFA